MSGTLHLPKRPASDAGARPYRVEIVTGDRRGTWGRYPTREHAETVAARLRGHGFDARAAVDTGGAGVADAEARPKKKTGGRGMTADLTNFVRSAENWFLDAATFAHDGDVKNAIAAAKNGIAALEDMTHKTRPDASDAD